MYFPTIYYSITINLIRVTNLMINISSYFVQEVYGRGTWRFYNLLCNHPLYIPIHQGKSRLTLRPFVSPFVSVIGNNEFFHF